MKTIPSKIFTFILTLGFLVSCNEIPEDVKSRAEKAQGTEMNTAADPTATLDELNASVDGIREYIKEKGYGRFEILPSVRIDKAEQLFEIEAEVVSDLHKSFPEIYKKAFGGDVYADSGCDDLDFFPLIGTAGESKFHRLYGSMLDGYMYNNVSDDGSVQDYLAISTGGFLAVEKNGHHDFETELKEIHHITYADNCDAEYKLVNGEKCSVSDAVSYVEKETAALFGEFDRDCTYHVKNVYAEQVKGKGTYSLYFDIEKRYKGVPVCDQVLTQFEDGARLQKPAYFMAVMTQPNKVDLINSAYGFDKIVSTKELTAGLVSLTQAFDILNNTLAPKMELSISDIKMTYYCDYDASDVYEARNVNVQLMTEKQSNAAGYPEITPGRKCRMFPVWQFVIDKNQKDANGNWKNKISCDILMINAQTGELMEFFNRVARL